MENSKGEPLVSVVSAYYNRVEHVTASIDSLLAQSYRNIEIVVVDDGSTDGTADALRAIDDPRFTVISRANRGFTASINEAVRASRGEIIAIHGSGDLSLPDRIARQAALLRERPDVGVVGCWVENDANDGTGTRLFQAPDGLPFYESLLRRSLFTHGEAMFRRSLFDQIGGYRDFFRLAQDRDLWLRMSRLANYAIVPEVLYRRVKIAGGVSTSAEKLVLQAYLSDFAVQCSGTRDENGRDLLDRHGHLAPFLRQRSRAAARRIGWLGARMMVNGDVDGGWAMVRRAKAEFLSRQVAIIYSLAAMHRVPALWRTVGRPILRARLRSFES